MRNPSPTKRGPGRKHSSVRRPRRMTPREHQRAAFERQSTSGEAVALATFQGA